MRPEGVRGNALQILNDLIGMRAFEAGAAFADHRPLEVHLQITSGCNLDCYMCHEHLRPVAERHGRHLHLAPPELFDILAETVLPYSRTLEIGVGGEPLLSPSWMEYLERAHALGQEIQLTTNGTLITNDEQATAIVRHSSTLEISIDGSTPGTYERIRRGARFHAIRSNLERIARARRILRQEERAQITLCMVLMRSNVHELPGLVEFAAELGFDRVAAWPVIGITPEGRNDRLDAAEAEPILARARRLARENGLTLDLPALVADEDVASSPRSKTVHHLNGSVPEHGPASNGSVPGTQRAHCHMPTVGIYVLYDGRVYPCGNPHAHGGPPLGNLLEQPFGEIWNGRAFRNLRAGLASGDLPEPCRTCPIVTPTEALKAPSAPASSTGLADAFGERDLAPLGDRTAGFSVIESLAWNGVGQQFETELLRMADLWRERGTMQEHIAGLEGEHDRMREHIANLESERTHLLGHVSNLERILGKIHGHRIYGLLSRVKDTILRS